MKITIQDLIDYLSKFGTKKEVFLDKDGWEDGKTPEEAIRNTGFISNLPESEANYIVINN